MNFIQWLFNFFRKEPDLPYPVGHLIPSPLDLRDISMGSVLTPTPIPPSYQIPFVLTHKNQGQTSECVAYSGSTINEFLQRVLGTDITFDPDWLYAKCKEIDGMPDTPGTYFRVMLSVLKNVGCLPSGGTEADIPKYKIRGYMSVDCTSEAIRQAIYAYGTVLMGFRGDNQGWQTAYIKKPLQERWGHATTGIGYDTIYIDGQNSWGVGWGAEGNFFVPPDYPPFECWAVINELPQNWELLLPDPKQKPKYTFNNDLVVGSTGTDVQMLQSCLVWFGCMSKADMNTGVGIFGQKTKVAVKLFQQRQGIVQTGNVMALTRSALNSIFI